MVEYPAELTVMFFYNLFVCFIALVVGLVVEKNASAWRIGSNVALASVVCLGIFSSCLSNTVHSWALRLKGPVYVAMFKPFSIAVAFALGIIFLADTPHLGSDVGKGERSDTRGPWHHNNRFTIFPQGPLASKL
ncbi:hypothetical protein V6N11_015546 [Hibiscus sabdariffa]|uniref:WAT1-related protein n=1 Tax=Hibiscus sabdariffa TaxID=183260 RepID=A0ABR2TSE4_9ROSI